MYPKYIVIKESQYCFTLKKYQLQKDTTLIKPYVNPSINKISMSIGCFPFLLIWQHSSDIYVADLAASAAATVSCLSSESLPTTATNLEYANIARKTTKVDKIMQTGLTLKPCQEMVCV